MFYICTAALLQLRVMTDHLNEADPTVIFNMMYCRAVDEKESRHTANVLSPSKNYHGSNKVLHLDSDSLPSVRFSPRNDRTDVE